MNKYTFEIYKGKNDKFFWRFKINGKSALKADDISATGNQGYQTREDAKSDIEKLKASASSATIE